MGAAAKRSRLAAVLRRRPCVSSKDLESIGQSIPGDALERLVVPLFAFFLMQTSRQQTSYVEQRLYARGDRRGNVAEKWS